jgi:nicotinamidase-related amidase
LDGSDSPDVGFLDDCVFISVDVQPGAKHEMTQDAMPADWQALGVTIEDVNEAIAHTYDIAHPNAARVAESCRRLGLPMVFIHWGYLVPDGMDLDPPIRELFLARHGPDTSVWPHHISRMDSRPADILRVQPGEYVIAKTAQDAFSSSNLEFVLRNLGVHNIVFVGGHTGACLGATAASAKRRGFRLLCVADATFTAFESRRSAEIEATGYDHVLSTYESWPGGFPDPKSRHDGEKQHPDSDLRHGG